jgi:hypothetical protein
MKAGPPTKNWNQNVKENTDVELSGTKFQFYLVANSTFIYEKYIKSTLSVDVAF